MEATVAERGQITLPKAVRDALGLAKGTVLKVELDGGRIILRKDVTDAISRVRGRFRLPADTSTDDVLRQVRGADADAESLAASVPAASGSSRDPSA